MKTILTTLFCLIICNCFSQTGTLSGNAFWKYNDYVGNRPDAGSEVYIYSIDSPFIKKNTQCDIQGNFRFENLKEGDYLIMIISASTNTNGEFNFKSFEENSVYTRKILGFSIIDIHPEYDSAVYWRKEYLTLAIEKPAGMKSGKWYKEVKNLETKYQLALTRVLLSIESTEPALKKVRMKVFPPKVYLKSVKVSANESTTVIADFNLTYTSN